MASCLSYLILSYVYLCVSSEEPYYTENNKHGVKLLYTFHSNSQSTLFVNISRSTGIQLVHCVPLNTIAALFSRQCGAPFIACWLIGPSSVTERASDDQRLGRMDDAFFVTEALHSKKLTRLKSELLGGNNFFFNHLRYAEKRTTRER